jgi:hypothetical protein
MSFVQLYAMKTTSLKTLTRENQVEKKKLG